MNLRRVVQSSLLVGVFFGIDKIAGLVRQVVIAQTYGVGPETDAFNAANNLPDALYSVISGGALAIALIPVLAAARERHGRPALWEIFSLVGNLAFVITGGLALVLALFPMLLVQQIVPNFSPEQQALTASLMRLYLIATVIFSLSGLVMGALQANQHFLLPALAPLLYNVGQLAGVWLLAPRFGIYGLVYGVIFGALLHLLIQLPALAVHGFRWTPRLTLAHPGVQQVLALMGPRVLTLACINLIFIARDRFASGLPEGAITALAYGWLIMQLPETVIGTAVGTALLPTMAEVAARGEAIEFRRLLRRALGALLALTLPIAVAAYFLLPLAVKLVFEGRAFTADDTAMVVQAAQFFMLGLVGHSVKEITARTFYAHQDARTPLATVVLTLIVFVAVAWALTPRLGFVALALADSLAFTLEAVVMVALLYRRRIL
jgi:putative peptidoglycan lipid II flippase